MIVRGETVLDVASEVKQISQNLGQKAEQSSIFRRALACGAVSLMVLTGLAAYEHQPEQSSSLAEICGNSIDCYLQRMPQPLDVPAAPVTEQTTAAPHASALATTETTAAPTTTTTTAPTTTTQLYHPPATPAGIHLNLSLHPASQPQGPRSGLDVSYPQCDNANVSRTTMTTSDASAGQSFAILGTDGGHNNKLNPCLADEANIVKSAGITDISLYANSEYPGLNPDPQIIPPEQIDLLNQAKQVCAGIGGDAYEPCVGRAYGEAGGELSFKYAQGLQLDTSRWWIDVETTNHWSGNKEANYWSIQGKIEGITAAASGARAPVPSFGIYSTRGVKTVTRGTADMPQQITGRTQAFNLPGWESNGLGSQQQALSRCSPEYQFNAQPNVMVQWGVKGGLDQDVMCP